jgi:hypothetical protein
MDNNNVACMHCACVVVLTVDAARRLGDGQKRLLRQSGDAAASSFLGVSFAPAEYDAKSRDLDYRLEAFTAGTTSASSSN